MIVFVRLTGKTEITELFAENEALKKKYVRMFVPCMQCTYMYTWTIVLELNV